MHGCGVADLFQAGDGGTTWTQALLVNALHSGGCGSDSMILSVAPDRSAWAATGRNGGACSTPFGLMFRYSGAAWQQLKPWQLTGISALAAVSRDVAYALSDQGALARADDGGQQWIQLLPAAAPTGQLDAVSETTAFGAQDATDAGAVLRSGNGGRSWDVIAQLPGVITQLDFPSASDGVAVTFQSADTWQPWLSPDGGPTWVRAGRLPAITDASIFGPWVSADGHGLLLTVTGNIPGNETAAEPARCANGPRATGELAGRKVACWTLPSRVPRASPGRCPEAGRAGWLSSPRAAPSRSWPRAGACLPSRLPPGTCSL
jgi:hypothetical protein